MVAGRAAASSGRPSSTVATIPHSGSQMRQKVTRSSTAMARVYSPQRRSGNAWSRVSGHRSRPILKSLPGQGNSGTWTIPVSPMAGTVGDRAKAVRTERSAFAPKRKPDLFVPQRSRFPRLSGNRNFHYDLPRAKAPPPRAKAKQDPARACWCSASAPLIACWRLVGYVLAVARQRAAAGLAEARRPGHELGRVRSRRQPARVHPVRRDPHSGAASADPRVDAGGHDRDRGRALLPATPASTTRESCARPSRTSRPARRSRAARRSRSSSCATSTSAASARSSARSARRSWREELEDEHSKRWILRELPQLGRLRHGRRPDLGRSAGGRADVLLEERQGADARGVGAAGRPAAGAERAEPVPEPARRARAPQPGAAKDGEARLHLRRPRAGGDASRRCGVSSGDLYTRIREPFFFDYVKQQLIDKFGVNTVRKGGLKVYTTIDPEAAGGRPQGDRLHPALPRRPERRGGRDRPAQRLHPGDGVELQLQAQAVQPRRAGPPPARLGLQDLRAHDGGQARASIPNTTTYVSKPLDLKHQGLRALEGPDLRPDLRRLR